MMLKRAWAVLEAKSFDDDARTFEGIASTISTDRMGDIVRPRGAKFRLPMPFLWQHNAREPVGHITHVTVTENEIRVQGKLAQVVEPLSLKDDLDRAWSLLKSGLVRGLSIGFSPIKFAEIKGSYGVDFLEWDWLELSAVTIPANSEASITAIKAMDAKTLRSLSAIQPQGRGKLVVSLNSGVPEPKTKGTTVNIQEQIKGFEAKRAANQARLEAIMSKAADDGGRTLDETEGQEYDNLTVETVSVDAHLVRLRATEKAMLANAGSKGIVPGTSGAAPVADPAAAASGQRQGSSLITYGKSELPKGTAFVRYAMALATSKGVRSDAMHYAERWKDSTPQVLNAIRNDVSDMVQRAAMTAGTTTDSDWAEPLVEYQTMASEFIDLLRPETILGKMSQLRRVPFNIRVAGKTQGSTVGWVGQGAPKPVSELKFNETTLGFAKAAGIVVISQELARFSSPSAEALIRQDMIDTMAQFLDEQFINPAIAAVANISPAAITNGIPGQRVVSTGSTLAQIYADVEDLFGLFITAKISVASAAWVMRPETALTLSLKRTSQDVFAFPGLSISGGAIFGLPVITSQSVPSSVSGGSIMVLVAQNEIFFADDGAVRIDVSEQASLQMESAPSAGAQSLVSLWQNNLVGIRAERFVNWQRRRDTAVAYIDQIAY